MKDGRKPALLVSQDDFVFGHAPVYPARPFVREFRQGQALIAMLMKTDPSLFNKDLAPIPADRRTRGMYNYVSLWVAMSVCIPTYMLASSLIAGGMNWWQSIG